MTMEEKVARTIAKARHGTDAMWANYMAAAKAVIPIVEAELQANRQEPKP